MKKTLSLFVVLFFLFGMTQAQDLYFSGKYNGTGKIWKNNTLVHSLSDSLSINPLAIQVTPEGMVYTAGYVYDTANTQGRIWLNDSTLFSASDNSVINSLILNGEDWTAGGYGENEWNIHKGIVWRNGEVLYSYSDTVTPNRIYALCIDTITGDIYAGGDTDSIGTATVWKNDTVFWEADLSSTICCLYHDGTNLYAGGYYYLEGLLMATLWENGEILYSFGDSLTSTFQAIAVYDGDVYTSGYADDSVFVWKNGEVLYSHHFNNYGSIGALCVNEYGVYYAGHIDNVGIVWKDGEILYQPEDCEEITSLVVLPPEPTPVYTLTVEANNTDWGTISGGGEYNQGDTATIAATPNLGCEFLYWNDSITDNPRNVVVTQDSTFIALFALSQYTIEVVSNHPDWGSVTGGGSYFYGDTVTISATPNIGHTFVGWNDGVTANPRTIIVTGDQTFTALFTIRQCLITTNVYPENSGIVNGGGSFYYGETIQLSANNNIGYVWSQWDDGDITNPRTVLVEDDATYTAIFTPLQYEITTECDPVDGGTITGAGIYDYGSTATLTATPNENYMFICWSDGIVSNPRNITVTGNANYKAMFYLNGTTQYTITVVANDPELGTVSGGGTYPEGTTIEISATPAENAVFVNWNDGNTDNPRSLIVTQDMSFKAIFEAIPVQTYTILVRSENPFQGSVYGSGTYPLNQEVTIGANPAPGFYFSGWQDDNLDNPRTIIVTGNAEYVASFSQQPAQTYTLTVYYDENQGFILGAGTYVAGATATLAAIPADGYMFVKWSDGTTDNPKEVIVDHDITLAAFFNGTGMDEYEANNLSLYPNPANDKIYIKGLEDWHEICVYSIMGILVKTTCVQAEHEINISELPAGFYLIRIDDGHALKFIKKQN